jgi:beta-barrel assembly-enhancing protease
MQISIGGCGARLLTLLAVSLLGGCLASIASPRASDPPQAKRQAASLVAPLPSLVMREAWPNHLEDVMNQRSRGMGLIHMPQMEVYLSSLYQRIKVAANVPQWQGRVYVLAASDLAAYVTEAGNAYVSLAWIEQAKSEDELIALISHEFSHVYLHYHRVTNTVDKFDTGITIAALAVAIQQKYNLERLDPRLTAFLGGYAAARTLIATRWSRNQEEDADLIGAQIAHKLGYSFTHGYKAFLERMQSWEEDQAKRDATRKAQFLVDLKSAVEEASLKRNQQKSGGQTPTIVDKFIARFDGTFAATTHAFSDELSGRLSTLFASHPDTEARMDFLALAAAQLPPEQMDKPAVIEPLEKAKAHSESAEILRNYRLAINVLSDLNHPEALAIATKSNEGRTAGHALPALALLKAGLANETNIKTLNNSRVDVFEALKRNMSSPQLGSWAVFSELASYYRQRGDSKRSADLLEAGIDFFKSDSVKYAAIARFVELGNFNRAKQLAQACPATNKELFEACRKAALTPNERSTQEAKDKQIAEDLFNRFKKK